MATIFKSENREFQENPGRIDHFRLFTDASRAKCGIDPKTLNFDLRLLNPGQFSSPYHFHRNAEELFVVLSGSMTVRTPNGLEVMSTGDMVFFEMGETGAHQVYNHGIEPCIYLDIRTFTGADICEYPDSGKTIVIPSMQVFEKEYRVSYFKGEENILEKWNEVKNTK